MRRNKTDERDDAERLRTVERLDDVRELLDEARRNVDQAREEADDSLGFEESDRSELLRLHDDLFDVCKTVETEAFRIERLL